MGFVEARKGCRRLRWCIFAIMKKKCRLTGWMIAWLVPLEVGSMFCNGARLEERSLHRAL